MFKLLCFLILCIITVSSDVKVKIRFDDQHTKRKIGIWIWPIDAKSPRDPTHELEWQVENGYTFPQGWYYVRTGSYVRKFYFGTKTTYLFTNGNAIGYF